MVATLLKTVLFRNVPSWALLALVAMGLSSFLIKGCADNRAIRELGGQVLSLQTENIELTDENTALASENISLKISTNSLARSQNALSEQLATNDAACKKQLSDRERIAAIKATDSCVVTAVEKKPVVPEGQTEKEIETVEVVSSETSKDIIYFFNDLFAAGVQP